MSDTLVSTAAAVPSPVQACPGCETIAEVSDRYCRQCGLALMKQECRHCDAPLVLRARFCVHCGKAVADGDAAGKDGARASERRLVTVMFTEIVGLSALSERLDPETISDVANQFFAVLTEQVYRYRGVVDKYIGDSVVMSLFGVPVEKPDDAVRAVSAAWAILGAARDFAASVESRIGLLLQVRCGINTGIVAAGEIGGSQKRDFTVLGDTVNLAQRMEANAPIGGVLVAVETFEMTKQHFEYRVLDPIRVKGKENPVAIYELTGPKAPQTT
ncbi:MAG: adenylate/guanylate cyclase domain-containing protein [bacterium]|nr:adenylate/guanylate cyclase domain-containing protein [bacterium]